MCHYRIRIIRVYVFFSIPDVVNEEEHDAFNDVFADDEIKLKHDDYRSKSNMLREKHRELRDTYDHLERAAAAGPKNEEFVEPKVQGLWVAAIENNFSGDQLAALKVCVCNSVETNQPYSTQTYILQ